MAKKKENQLSYMQMPLPASGKSYKMTKRSWNGLNYRHTIDTGALSMEKNISTLEAPCLVPSQKRAVFIENKYTYPIGMFGFDDFLIVIYRKGTNIKVDYITADNDVYTGTLKSGAETNGDDDYPRCVVQFNKYEESDDILSGGYTKKLLIFPDKKSMYFEITDDFELENLDITIKKYRNNKEPYLPPDGANHDCYYQNTAQEEDENGVPIIYEYKEYEIEDDEGNTDTEFGWVRCTAIPAFPDIKYATVHLSRVFGVSDDSVYASGFNDYTNWNLDTIDAYNESNAWCSKAQSNTKADGNFTGIINFQGHIICFKRDFMHEIYNTKNPFRIQDVYAEGAVDHRTIQDVDGRLIFVSEDGVKIYTGSNPKIIDYDLNMSKYVNACSGTDGRCYYLYCEDAGGKQRLFVYDTFFDFWSEQSISETVLSFVHNKNGMYMLVKSGTIYKMNTGDYGDDTDKHEWSFETDLITNETVNIKHIKKLQMLIEKRGLGAIKVYMLYDNEAFEEDKSHLVYETPESDYGGRGLKTIRVKPRKTVNFGVKLHVEGWGYVKIHELELFTEPGGELYV